MMLIDKEQEMKLEKLTASIRRRGKFDVKWVGIKRAENEYEFAIVEQEDDGHFEFICQFTEEQVENIEECTRKCINTRIMNKL